MPRCRKVAGGTLPRQNSSVSIRRQPAKIPRSFLPSASGSAWGVRHAIWPAALWSLQKVSPHTIRGRCSRMSRMGASTNVMNHAIMRGTSMKRKYLPRGITQAAEISHNVGVFSHSGTGFPIAVIMSWGW
jgi:hypothetical protein